MKTLKIVTVAMLLSLSAKAQTWEIGSSFMFSQPSGSMKQDMNNAFGMTFEGARRFKAPIALGVEFSLSQYGSQTTKQEYTFDDGTTTQTNVNVTNNIYNIQFTGKYFFRNGKNINPYLSGKLGWSFFKTTLNIEDPDDQYSCHPLENDVLQKDNTYAMTAGVGARVDFSALFKNVNHERVYFDLSIQSIQGGRLQYMNVKHDPQAQPVPDKDVMANSSIHKHR